MPLNLSPATTQAPIAEIGADAPFSTAPRGPSTLAATSVRWNERILAWIFIACAFVSVLTTFSIIYVLVTESWPFFQSVSLATFLGGTKWAPLIDQTYGVLPLVCGTILVTAGAAVFALPLGLLSAIYLSEYASPKARGVLKPVLEILAGIPSIVYGYFALVVITPLLQKAFPGIEVFNALSASIAVAIMTLPLVSSLCEDALHVVPRALREGAYALGATKMEVSTQVVVPAALSGIGAAFLLAISRAIGETMIVALAAGATPTMTLSPLRSIQTMTGYIAQTAMGDVEHGTTGYQTIYAVGILLFAMTVALNLFSISLVKKYRQKYD